MPWQTFPHEADIGVRGSGATLAEAFAGAATALTAAICDPATVAPREALAVECDAPDVELLLVDWLNALIFAMATRHLLFSRFEVAIDGSRLHATAWGEPLEVARHQPAAEAKGVSLCELKVVRQADGQWLAQAVVDV
ncbi:SHS2 domain-containing protein [Azotobacter beijerinckii]|uniref:SHS2 domain-containing protein n=1 Tax=Azotobacter beijerinckii TaxID=170623 RepID=A0A1H6YVS0_9GAMM|nr:archease [Azotobacter beijerinckii]SEJ43904.1 SHS2 domain-containing protein [Azotobacter beijerinckii]SER17377.1 SHS2 domain-containing protein [Azotobacter beijerinckii]